MTEEDKGIAYRTRVNGIDVAVDMDGDYIVNPVKSSSTPKTESMAQNYSWVLTDHKQSIMEMLDNPKTISFNSKYAKQDLITLTKILMEAKK